MHRKVFAAIHVDRQRLDKPADIAAFMTKNGVDGAKFLDAYNCFSVQTKARQATQLAQAYKIDGVPALGIQGRYFTSASLAGSPRARAGGRRLPDPAGARQGLSRTRGPRADLRSNGRRRSAAHAGDRRHRGTVPRRRG